MRKWLITGVSSGFGFEMTKQLLAKGNKVIGTVRNTKNIQDFMKNPNFDCKILDVTDTIERLESRIADYKTQNELAASTDVKE